MGLSSRRPSAAPNRPMEPPGRSSAAGADGTARSRNVRPRLQSSPPTLFLKPRGTRTATLFLGGVTYEWRNKYRTADANAFLRGEANAAAWLRTKTLYDFDVVVQIIEKPHCLVGVAAFHGPGNAPFVAARRAVGPCMALDPDNDLVMFREVKLHHGFAQAERLAQLAQRADDDVVRRDDEEEPWPDEVWRRALVASSARPDVFAFGRPLVHNSLKAARFQCDRDSDTCRRVWAFDLPPRDGGGAPKRYVTATLAEFGAAYAQVPAPSRHVYEVIDASQPCLPFFDLEFSRVDGRNADVDGDALTWRVVHEAQRQLRAAAGSRGIELPVLVLASDRPTKFSRHVLIRPRWEHVEGAGELAPLRDSRAAGRLAAAVTARLGAEVQLQAGGANATACFVDAAVYSRDRCFRVLGSTKYGDDIRAALVAKFCDEDFGRGPRRCRAPAVDEVGLHECLVVPELPDDFNADVDCLVFTGPARPPAVEHAARYVMRYVCASTDPAASEA